MLKLFVIFVPQMNLSATLIFRKIATVLLITASAAAFATLGDGGKKTFSAKNLLSKKASYNFKSFSLKTGYQYRGSIILSLQQQNAYVSLNTVTYNRGNTTYILPLKKKLVLDKIKFNPASIRY